MKAATLKWLAWFSVYVLEAAFAEAMNKYFSVPPGFPNQRGWGAGASLVSFHAAVSSIKGEG